MQMESGFYVRTHDGKLKNFNFYNEALAGFSREKTILDNRNKKDGSEGWVRLYGIYGLMRVYGTRLRKALI